MDKQSEVVYNSLLNDNKLLPLSSFKSQKFSKYNIFPHAQSLPSFFDNNLKSDGRIVKYLKGPEGPLRAFYYQLFKLGFEIDSPNTDYASIIKSIIFDPNLASYSTSPMSGKQYNISQYQRIIAEFMKILELQVIPNAELTFSQYPIIDESMLTILQLILQKSQLEPYRKIQNLNELIERLCEIFGITLEIYENCFSFEESDVFLYVESPISYYLAFLSEMAEVQSFEKTSQSPLQVQYKQQLSSLSYGDKKEESRQVNIYRDMRLSAGNKGTRARITNNKSPKQSKSNNYGSSSFGVYTNKSRFHSQYNDYQLNEMNRSIRTKQELEESDHIYHKNVFESSSSIPVNGKPKNYATFKEGQSFSNHNELSSSPQVSDIVDKNQSNQQREQSLIENNAVNKKSEQIDSFKLNGINHEELTGKANNRSINSEPHQNKDIQINHYEAQHQTDNKSSKLNPVLDNVQTFKSISDGAQQNLQMFKNVPDYFSRVEYRAQDFMNNNIIETLDPKLIKKSPKASVTLKEKIFSYQFKSHKFQKLDQKQTVISLNENLEINSRKDISKNIIDNNAGLSLIKTAETANTFIHSSSNSNKFQTQKQFGRQNKQTKTENYKDNFKIEKQLQINKISCQNKIQMDFYKPKINPGRQFENRQFEYIMNSDRYKADIIISNSSKFQNSKQQTLGTYYRQFSDTKVMEAMTEPYSSKVRRTRQKFKGIRSKNFKGLY